MSSLLENFQPWIAKSIYDTITLETQNFSHNSEQTNITSLTRRPRLAQVVSRFVSTDMTDGLSLTSMSSSSKINNIQSNKKILKPLAQLIVSDGMHKILVYIMGRIKPNIEQQSVQKGAIVTLRNWSVSCTSFVVKPFNESSLPMCLVLYEERNETDVTVNNISKSTPWSCLESMGGEGMSVVGSPLDVHDDSNVKRALSAMYDPAVLARQVLDWHHFQRERIKTKSGDDNNTKCSSRVILGCDVDLGIIDIGSLDTVTIGKVIEARIGLKNNLEKVITDNSEEEDVLGEWDEPTKHSRVTVKDNNLEGELYSQDGLSSPILNEEKKIVENFDLNDDDSKEDVLENDNFILKTSARINSEATFSNESRRKIIRRQENKKLSSLNLSQSKKIEGGFREIKRSGLEIESTHNQGTSDGKKGLKEDEDTISAEKINQELVEKRKITNCKNGNNRRVECLQNMKKNIRAQKIVNNKNRENGQYSTLSDVEVPPVSRYIATTNNIKEKEGRQRDFNCADVHHQSKRRKIGAIIADKMEYRNAAALVKWQQYSDDKNLETDAAFDICAWLK